MLFEVIADGRSGKTHVLMRYIKGMVFNYHTH